MNYTNNLPLAVIAAQMRSYAIDNPQWGADQIPTPDHKRVLVRGLHLACWINLTDWCLGLKRVEVAPSLAEVKICRGAFAVPDNASIGELLKQREFLCYWWNNICILCAKRIVIMPCRKGE